MFNFNDKKFTFGNEYTQFVVIFHCTDNTVDAVSFDLFSLNVKVWSYIMGIRVWTEFVRFINSLDTQIQD